jgi:two-component system alkaline phosphatase synthesis response regulator PhoP
MKKQVYRILVVDDEPDILELVGYIMEREGFKVSTASNGSDALSVAKVKKPDLIILDVMMPDLDGIEVCHQLRAIPEFDNTFIAFLTARGEDYSQIAGFEAGADDYIIKPIRPKTLVARVRSILKRRTKDRDGEDRYEVGGLSIDKEKRQVVFEKKELNLPKKEFDLLVYLSSEPGKVFSRDAIYRKLWKSDIVVGDRTIDVHIRKLRSKIGEKRITTLKGVGYRFEG